MGNDRQAEALAKLPRDEAASLAVLVRNWPPA
jgi:hypothetical protein